MPRRLTTQEFIEKAKAVHGDRYDYSQVEYLGSQSKVTIGCPDHGPFDQVPPSHLNRRGCPYCAGTKKLDTGSFVEKARALHGDRYDYSSANYVNAHTPVTIVCTDHGAFTQTPTDHIHQGSGCPDCGGTKILSTQQFIEKAKAVHGDRYDYSQVEYLNGKTPVTIICPDHGPFPQTKDGHISNRSGCPACAGRPHITTEEFIERVKAIHGGRYDYSQVHYENMTTPVIIDCPDHGAFQQLPLNHLSGAGCIDCAGTRQRSTEIFIDMAKAVHGDRYDYSQVEYVNNATPVTINCPDHGLFDQLPTSHINQKSVCPDCAESGFNPSKPAILYYLAVATDDSDTRYKIGISNRAVEDRFRLPDMARIRIVKVWRYVTGRAAKERELEILNRYVGDRYFGPPILQSGNSELFTHDVLGLDDAEK